MIQRRRKGKAATITTIEAGYESSTIELPKKSFCGICFDFIPENDIVKGSGTYNHPFVPIVYLIMWLSK